MALKFINKLYTKAIFSEDSTLNVVAADMGESMIEATINDDIVKRLPTATGTIGSMNIYVAVDITFNILKTSSCYNIWRNRMLNDGAIGGTLTIYDDINGAWTIEDISLTRLEVPAADGNTPDIRVVISGNAAVNKDALGGY